MARPKKIGLDYFPLDVVLEDDVELIEAEHGLGGFAILIKLWQKIYSEGYYIKWSEDNALLFARKINSDINLVNAVVNSCLNRGLFNKGVHEQYQVLTSAGIQNRYVKACSDCRRKDIILQKELALVETELITELIEFTHEESAQKKREEKKRENTLFDSEECKNIRKAFPGTKTVSVARNKLPKLIDKYSFNQMMRTVERYKQDVENKRKTQPSLSYLNESTFWNGRFEDYLDENSKEDEPKPTYVKPKKAGEKTI